MFAPRLHHVPFDRFALFTQNVCVRHVSRISAIIRFTHVCMIVIREKLYF